MFPRGGHASQDSTGTTITFDSASVASRFAVNNWIQAGLATANVRRVSAIGGNSIAVSGAAVTVAENDRIFLIGNTQPSITGGSATYIIPQSIIRQRDDDGADIFTNSMVTSNSDGLIQFWAEASVYDLLIQDGNQANQGSIIDLAVGAVEGISTSSASIFGATVTFLAGVSMNTTLIVGQSATFNGAVGITGTLTVGQSFTANAASGFTGTATFSGQAIFGASATINGNLGVTGSAVFGGTTTINNVVGITGDVTISGSGSSLIITGTGTPALHVQGVNAQVSSPGTFSFYRAFANQGNFQGSTYFTLSAGWGSTATNHGVRTGSMDSAGGVIIEAGGAGLAANPTVTMLLRDGLFSATTPIAVGCFGRSTTDAVLTSGMKASMNTAGGSLVFTYGGTPTEGQMFEFSWHIFGL